MKMWITLETVRFIGTVEAVAVTVALATTVDAAFLVGAVELPVGNARN